MIDVSEAPAFRAGEICLRRELSQAGNVATVGSRAGHPAGDGSLPWSRAVAAEGARSGAAQRVEASVRYMMQHLNQPMRVSHLSAMAGLSESSFFALFKRATGRTPLDFFIRARMKRAAELLATTTLQVKEAAALLGYEDQFYFSRLFKSVHGIPPREYRARKVASHHPFANSASGHMEVPAYSPDLRAKTFPDQTCSKSVHP
jgi:AraC-like DNA-binding protein